MDRDSTSDELTDKARTRIGQRLRDKWRLDDLLGVGGMAAVYAATHRNGKRVAIKILHREVALSDDARTRFLREGYVANSVEHKGAVSVLDDDVTEDGAPFVVMDLFDGETLDQRQRRKGRLDPDDVLATTYHLLDVMAAAHDRGIIHRDIKPENVFLTRDAGVKVLDFGIAQLRELSARTGATRLGHTMGTPSFMPPEQARGRWDEVDARSDLWAVGATMFTLLTGRHVHEADTINEVLLAAMASPAKSIALYRPDLPPAVVEVVDRALRFAKEERFPSARAMQSAVQQAYGAKHASSAEWSNAPTLIATSVSAPALPPSTLTPPSSTTARPIARTASLSRTLTSKRGAWGVAIATALTVAIGSASLLTKHAPTASASLAPIPSQPQPQAHSPILEPPPQAPASTPEPHPELQPPTPEPQPRIQPRASNPTAHRHAVAPSPSPPAAAPHPASDPLDRRH